MGMLTVQIDETATELGKLGCGREPAIHVSARATLHRYDTREYDLVVVDHEPALHTCLARAVAYQLRIGAAAAQQLERVHDQRLPRPGLARDHGEAVRERQPQLGDDPEGLDVQLGQHGSGPTGPAARTSFSRSGGSRAGAQWRVAEVDRKSVV